MAKEDAGCMGKVIATVFTTVVAPVLVGIMGNVLAPVSKAPGAGLSQSQAQVPDRDGPREIVVSHGEGRSVAEAGRAALREAVRKAVVSVSETTFTSSQSEAACDAVLSAPETIILRCDLGLIAERHTGLQRYARDAVVEFAHRPLQDRLNATGMPLHRQ